MLRNRLLPVTTAAAACAGARTETRWDGGEMVAAAQLQRALLPPSPYAHGRWSAAHRYSPAGEVGGDILDLVASGDDWYFVLADISGKGVAAALLSAYVHAVFRSLIPFGLPIEEVVRRASALLCASTLPAQYATLVFGVLTSDGDVVVANAGHPPPFVVGQHRQALVVPTGTAAGLFCDSEFGSTRLRLNPGETLVLYTDGVTEAFDDAGHEYGADRLQAVAASAAARDLPELLAHVGADHDRFLSGAPRGDDFTLLAIRRRAHEFTDSTPDCHNAAL